LSLWAPNAPDIPGVLSLVSPGFNSATALRYSKRINSIEGPTYVGFRNIDMACLTPGSTWRVAAQLKLLNRSSGQGVGCDVNKRDDCPSIRISMRNGDGDRFFAAQYRSYTSSVWKADAFNRFQADFVLPARPFWDGRIKTIELTIRDFPALYDLVADDISLSPIVL
jgi:hypothetical protein